MLSKSFCLQATRGLASCKCSFEIVAYHESCPNHGYIKSRASLFLYHMTFAFCLVRARVLALHSLHLRGLIIRFQSSKQSRHDYFENTILEAVTS